MNLKMPLLIFNNLRISRFMGATRVKSSGWSHRDMERGIAGPPWLGRTFPQPDCATGLGLYSPDPHSPDLLLSRPGGEIREMRVRGVGT